jgi:nucleotide-binding universal stress UspA family protein
MLSKILVPVDGSENSFRALEQAIFWQQKYKKHKLQSCM